MSKDCICGTLLYSTNQNIGSNWALADGRTVASNACGLTNTPDLINKVVSYKANTAQQPITKNHLPKDSFSFTFSLPQHQHYIFGLASPNSTGSNCINCGGNPENTAAGGGTISNNPSYNYSIMTAPVPATKGLTSLSAAQNVTPSFTLNPAATQSLLTVDNLPTQPMNAFICVSQYPNSDSIPSGTTSTPVDTPLNFEDAAGIFATVFVPTIALYFVAWGAGRILRLIKDA